MADSKTITQRIAWALHPFIVFIGAAMLTLACFLVLPLMQAIGKPPENDVIVRTVGALDLPPPPPPPPAEEEEQKEPEPEEEKPELIEEPEPLTLEQISMALNPTIGEGVMVGDFATKVSNLVEEERELDAVFSLAELDQKPRVIYQPGPIWTNALRKKAPGTVYVVFTVNARGTVEQAIVEQTSDPIFNKAALGAVKQWKFEPGRRNGTPVRFRMRVPIVFPRGR